MCRTTAISICDAGRRSQPLPGAPIRASDLDTQQWYLRPFLREQVGYIRSLRFQGSEEKPLRVDLHRLMPEERALQDDVRDNRIRLGLRLEQENTGFHWLAHRLDLLDGTGTSNSASLP